MIEMARIPLALYVHLPWCVRKCPYCDFNSHALPSAGLPERAYVAALLADLEHAASEAEGREVVAAPAAAWRSISGLSLSRPSPHAWQDWLAADIADGLPQVFAATSEQFIPQMLNVDLVDGVSFTKGCYTGQEIVARTHHLGRVKRRSMRFVLPAGDAPAPMSNLLFDGAKAADVLVTATLPDRVEVLAVTSLDAAGKALATEDGRRAEPRALPYDLRG